MRGNYMDENWRKMKILPSEQLRLLDLLQKYGVQIVLEEIDHLKETYKLK